MTAITKTTSNSDDIDEMVQDLTGDLPLTELKGALGFLICLPDSPLPDTRHAISVSEPRRQEDGRRQMEQLYHAGGMDDMVSKPIDQAELVRVLTCWLPPEKIAASQFRPAQATA